MSPTVILSMWLRKNDITSSILMNWNAADWPMDAPKFLIQASPLLMEATSPIHFSFSFAKVPSQTAHCHLLTLRVRPPLWVSTETLFSRARMIPLSEWYHFLIPLLSLGFVCPHTSLALTHTHVFPELLITTTIWEDVNSLLTALPIGFCFVSCCRCCHPPTLGTE